MEQTPEQSITGELVELALRDLAEGNTELLRQALTELHPAEIADLLEGMPPEERRVTWELVPEDIRGEVLTHVHDEARATLIDEMDHAELVSAAEQMDVEDLAEVLGELPDDLTESILAALDRDHRQRLEAVLSYPEESAGRLMSTDVISVRRDVTLAVVLRWLRRHHELPPHTDALMVLANDGRYLGRLDMADLVTNDPGLLVAEVMKAEAETVRASASEREIAALFDRRDLISVAVLDQDDRLLGRITVDDVLDVIREDADRRLLQTAGLEEEEDLFAPVIPSAQRRGVWLGINLVTVLVAAWVIGNFEEALSQIVALAVLMPVVASMGGIAGSQTLTLTIRGLALDQIASSNVRWLTVKEIFVGILNGLIWAAVVAVVAYLWFQSGGLAAVIAAAMVINLLAAAASGVAIPLVLHRVGIDPALSGAVILTTVTDVVGFLSFLGLASLFLL
ncbi:magnesium transporter [Thiococcus pfennigii]|uniref:magnesium transporter n=1 Tax=Thiococcus pfennigii TaxID=1057 RepID=UPI001908684A|nr:magnesium transporter [Thiococcus pfennigii]MBK1700542.1 magnesium transporter [Thiococcus pfennigii]MBK1731847.1 magnesium transporter [Thiococcus pfennigii]